MKTQYSNCKASHKPCRAVKLRETSMLVHLQIILAESDKITKSKLKRQAGFVKKKHFFFVVRVCLRFQRPVEVAQMKTTYSLRVVVAQKKFTRFGRKRCKRILMLS